MSEATAATTQPEAQKSDPREVDPREAVPMTGLVLRVRAFVHRFRELARFGVIGALAYIVDVGVFNLLMFGPGEVLAHKPLTVKVISVAIATIVSWLGNRYWTFAASRNPRRLREILMFAAVNVGGLLIGLACLWFTVYVLNLRGPVAANVSANGVGLVLGTAFRFFAYKYLVFTHGGTPADPAGPGDDAAPA